MPHTENSCIFKPEDTGSWTIEVSVSAPWRHISFWFCLQARRVCSCARVCSTGHSTSRERVLTSVEQQSQPLQAALLPLCWHNVLTFTFHVSLCHSSTPNPEHQRGPRNFMALWNHLETAHSNSFNVNVQIAAKTSAFHLQSLPEYIVLRHSSNEN